MSAGQVSLINNLQQAIIIEYPQPENQTKKLQQMNLMDDIKCRLDQVLV